MAAARKLKRVTIERSTLYYFVTAWAFFAVVGLTVWTAVDPRQPHKHLTLLDETNSYGETVVQLTYYCRSDSIYWLYVVMLIHFCLLMWAAVLAFQTRNVPQRFNESKVLAAVIYTQCFFLAFRAVLMAFPNDSISPVQSNGFASVATGLDSLFTLLIYFVPKLVLFSNASSNTASAAISGIPEPSGGTECAPHSVNPSPPSDPEEQRPFHSVERDTAAEQFEDEAKNIAQDLVVDLQNENDQLKDAANDLQSDNDKLKVQVVQLEEKVSLLEAKVQPEKERAAEALDAISSIFDFGRSCTLSPRSIATEKDIS